MSDFIVTVALKGEGLNEQQVAQVQAAMPAFERILNLAVADKDTMQALWTLIQKMTPLGNEIAKDLPVVLPALKLVVSASNKW